MIRILLAEDHHLVREALKALMENAEDIQIVGEAENGLQAIELALELAPDVMITDINMPFVNGIEVATRLRSEGIPTAVVILSMYCDQTLVRQAIASGACGYVLKHSVTEDLLLAVRAAVLGKTFYCKEVKMKIPAENSLEKSGVDNGLLFEILTSRERQILQMIAEGRTNKEIALVIRISERTVEKHRASLMRKLDIHDLASLVKVAIKHGLTQIEN